MTTSYRPTLVVCQTIQNKRQYKNRWFHKFPEFEAEIAVLKQSQRTAVLAPSQKKSLWIHTEYGRESIYHQQATLDLRRFLGIGQEFEERPFEAADQLQSR